MLRVTNPAEKHRTRRQTSVHHDAGHYLDFYYTLKDLYTVDALVNNRGHETARQDVAARRTEPARTGVCDRRGFPHHEPPAQSSLRDSYHTRLPRYPAMNRWAIIICPSGAVVRRSGAYGDRCAEATGDAKAKRSNVKRIPVALKRCAIIIYPFGEHAPPPGHGLAATAHKSARPGARVGRDGAWLGWHGACVERYGAWARPCGAARRKRSS
jgi:hypothetical protein